MFWFQLMGTRLPLAAEAEMQSFAPASRCCLGKVGHGQHLCERFMSFCGVNVQNSSALSSHGFTAQSSWACCHPVPPNQSSSGFLCFKFRGSSDSINSILKMRGEKKDPAVQNQLKIAFL